MGQTIYQVDAFADAPFRGNPAGVCLLERPGDDGWMQNVALEMNLSETAFLYPQEDGFHLRWFTPVAEVELCGHATLASAHILFETGRLKADEEARFHTLSGLLTAQRQGQEVVLNFPSTPPRPAKPPAGLAVALGFEPTYVGRTRFDFLLEAESEAVIRGLRPDFTALAAMPARGFIVTSRASRSGYDFVSRFFAPGLGIDEDPVTGAAHCCLGPYWSDKLGKSELMAFQASARGGSLRVNLADDRVQLAGRAVTVLKGELLDS